MSSMRALALLATVASLHGKDTMHAIGKFLQDMACALLSTFVHAISKTAGGTD